MGKTGKKTEETQTIRRNLGRDIDERKSKHGDTIEKEN